VEGGRSVVSSTCPRAFTNNRTYLFALNLNVSLNGKDLLLRVCAYQKQVWHGGNESIVTHSVTCMAACLT
jgi:hypothetical protein